MKTKFALTAGLVLCPLAMLRIAGRAARCLRIAGFAVVCMSLFLFPTLASADENAPPSAAVSPPIVHAEIVGNLLRITAASGFYPVEAVFVNDRRFNHRVDSALVIDISSYVAQNQLIAVYAIDFAGNPSNTVLLTPPAAPPPIQTLPFTPDGHATVIDQATDADGKQFLTFETPAGNIFHLIIDHQRGRDNVYFLNAVTERDLIALAESAGYPIAVQAEPPPPVAVQPEPEPPQEPTPPDTNGGGRSTAGILVVLLLLAGGGGFLFYMRLNSMKKQKAMYADEDSGGNYEEVTDYDGGDVEEIEPDENQEARDE